MSLQNKSRTFVSSRYKYASSLRGAWLCSAQTPFRNLAINRGLGDLTPIGSPTLVTGPVGLGVALNGTSQYLTNTLNTAVVNVPITMAGWFLLLGVGAGQRILDISPGTGVSSVIGLLRSGTVTVAAQHYSGASNTIPITVQTNEWVFLVARFYSLTYRDIWLNGAFVNSDTGTNSAPSGLDRVTLGFAPWSSTEYFEGAYSNILLFDTYIPDQEIVALYEDPNRPFRSFRHFVLLRQSTTGSADVTGTATITPSAQTLTGSGGVAVSGTASITPAAQTLTASGGVAVSATASVTPSAQTVTASGTVVSGVEGTANITPAAQTVTANGTIPVSATATITPSAQTTTATGAVAVAAIATITPAAQTLSATGTVVSGVVGTASITQAAQTATASGTVEIIATAGVTPAAQTLSATGTVSGGTVTGTANIFVSAQTLVSQANIIVLGMATITPAPQTLTAYEAGVLPDEVPESSRTLYPGLARLGSETVYKRLVRLG